MQYKITRIYIIDAASPVEALELLKRVGDPLKHLVFETVRPLVKQQMIAPKAA